MSELTSSVYVDLAKAKIAEGDVAGAEELYQTALAKNPTDLGALVGFARLLAKRPDGYHAAEQLLDRACTAHPRAAVPRVARADLCHAMGRHGQARAEFAEAERLDPKDPEVRAYIERHVPAAGGFLAKLKRLVGRTVGPKADVPPPREAARAPKGPICPYCGGPVRPGGRACGRCGAALRDTGNLGDPPEPEQ
jgi:tetratricopeptide (TPR) repeat protein